LIVKILKRELGDSDDALKCNRKYRDAKLARGTSCIRQTGLEGGGTPRVKVKRGPVKEGLKGRASKALSGGREKYEKSSRYLGNWGGNQGNRKARGGNAPKREPAGAPPG